MLTPEQITELRAKVGIPPQGLGAQQPASAQDRIAKLRTASGYTAPAPSLVDRVNTDLTDRGNQLADAVTRPMKVAQSGAGLMATGRAVAESGLNAAGAAGGALLDVGNEALRTIPGVGAFMDHVTNNLAKQTAEHPDALGPKLLKALGDLATKHPQAAQDVGSVLNIVGAATGMKGAQAVGEKLPAIAEGATNAINKTAGAFNSVVKAPITAAQDLATPIDQNVMKVLKSPTPNTEATLKTMFTQAKKAMSTTGEATPYDMAGKKAFGNAMKTLKTKLDEAGNAMQESLATNGTKTADISAVHQAFDEGLQSRLGTAFGEDGTLADAAGRKSVIANSAADTKMIKLVKSSLSSLGQNPTVQEINDTVDALQGELYKAPMKGAEALNGNTQGFVKKIVGQLNGVGQETAGEGYTAANETYARLKQLQTDLNGKLGANYKNSGAWMKRIFSPSDGGIKTLITQLEQETGQPIFHDATLAKFAMDAVGDPRAQSILKELQSLEKSPGGVVKRLMQYVQDKLANPEGRALRIINKASGGADEPASVGLSIKDVSQPLNLSLHPEDQALAVKIIDANRGVAKLTNAEEQMRPHLLQKLGISQELSATKEATAIENALAKAKAATQTVGKGRKLPVKK